MDYITIFMLGMLVGSAATLGYGWYQLRKIAKVKRSLLKQIEAKVSDVDKKKDSIKTRLLKATELAKAQVDLRAQLDMPSKNALHSKYKNDIVADIYDLEQQKIDILKTVLGEGYDPMITMVDEGGVRTQVLLSTYIGEAAANLNGGTTPPNDSNQPKKVGKFILHKGGKDEGKIH